jgi:L-seryl-tRNA(Ser) seleniumtransferase
MDIYQELGVPAFINAVAPYTRFGGAIMPPAVVEAMAQAARHGTLMADLHIRAGHAIAQLTHNQAAYVSCGAAAGITLAIATCMAGTDPAKSDRLPDTSGMKNRVLMYAPDRGTECDTAIRNAGATIVNVGKESGAGEADWLAAIDQITAAIVVVAWGEQEKLPLPRLVELAHARGVPVIVDAADSVPPKEHLWKFTRDQGADAVIASGGKGLGGPQSAGLVLGTQTIIDGCLHHGLPGVRIGRGMKVGKEEIAGMYTAVKLFMAQDENQLRDARAKQADFIVNSVGDLPGITLRRPSPTRVELVFDVAGTSSEAARDWFLTNDPAILLRGSKQCLGIETSGLHEGDERTIAQQVRRFFVEGLPNLRQE